MQLMGCLSLYLLVLSGLGGLVQPGVASPSEDPATLSSQLTQAQPPVQTAPTPFPTFNSPQLDRQIQRYQTFLATFGRPDILIVGSSRALWGIDPIALQDALARRGYPNLKVFNFGVNGATAQVTDFVVRRVLPPDHLPRLIVWADGVRAFNSGRLDQTYRNILVSQGYRQLATGIRPIVVNPAVPIPEQICVEIPPSPIAQLFGSPRPLPSSETPATSEAVDATVPRSAPRLLCGQKLNLLAPLNAVIAPRPSLAEAWETTGFQPLFARFDPRTYFRRYARVPGEYDGDYRDFTLDGVQSIALKNLLKFTQARRVPVVFVSLPLTQIYFDPERTFREQQFRSQMQRLAQAGQLTFLDYSRRWLTQHQYYIDPSHLNRYGAEVVANQISQEINLVKFGFSPPFGTLKLQENLEQSNPVQRNYR